MRLLKDRPLDPPEGNIDLDKVYDELVELEEELTEYRGQEEVDNMQYFLNEYGDVIDRKSCHELYALLETVRGELIK